LETGLDKLKQQAESGRLRERQKADRRIGRLLERNSRASALFDITTEEQGAGIHTRLKIRIKKHEDRLRGSLPHLAATFFAPPGQRKIPGRYGRRTFNWLR